MHRTIRALTAVAFVFACRSTGLAAGVLTPVGSIEQPIVIRQHHVNVVINNGFARTEVTQTFFNPNAQDLEAVYSFPVPAGAALSEMTIFLGETEIHGEVLPRQKAKAIYEEEKKRGSDAGLAQKNEFKTFEFNVWPVGAKRETKVRFVYYQPLVIDTGLGRYVYPLEPGGTDDQASRFWTTNDKVEGGTFSADVELKSAAPVTAVRLPGFENDSQTEQLGPGHFRVKLERRGARLNRDLVFYYRLADNLPGRVELVAYRPDRNQPGTFMLTLTPGVDLKPLDGGTDYLFVLDTSGSMANGKLQTLAAGVQQAIGRFEPRDRFRIVSFNDTARDLTEGWMSATPENVQRGVGIVQAIRTGGSTNLFAGLKLGLQGLDSDRATVMILVTDGVTNTGQVDPAAFDKLMKQVDVRLFGFLIGNSGNWPLMRTISDATGGFYTNVSNADDVLGQILLAKGKVTHEALHDVYLTFDGVVVHDTTNGLLLKKVYHGQQLVIFGRYDHPGVARVTLRATITGEDQTYATTFDFPEVDTSSPEIERLWALDRIDETQTKAAAGLIDSGQSQQIVRDLGVAFQIVTDETSMVVLSDQGFGRHGIDRLNQQRTVQERQAQTLRQSQPVRDNRVDQVQPMFAGNAPSVTGSGSGGGTSGGGASGGGGGAIDPVTGVIALGLGVVAVGAARRRKCDASGQPS